jgi:hypothetical protein
MVVARRVVLSGIELSCATVLMSQFNRLLLSRVERSFAVVLVGGGVVLVVMMPIMDVISCFLI